MVRVAVGAMLALGAALAQEAPAKAEGSASAPIVVDVFSDFQCPACKVLYEGTLRQLRDEYVAPGKVYLVHRDFPLPMHRYARDAACYATASLRVNKYERVCEALFQRQAAWSADGKIENALAGVLTPVELKKVSVLAKDPRIAAEVQRDVELGTRGGVRQTPTLVIAHRGRRYPVGGNINYAILRRFLDQLLSN